VEREAESLRAVTKLANAAAHDIAEMITHMTRVTRLTAITDLDTGGVPTLDLRRSSEPSPEGEPRRGEGETPHAS